MEDLLHYIVPFDDLDPTLVDHLCHYLSVCPIGHPLRPFVSWDSQGSTVQGLLHINVVRKLAVEHLMR